MEKNISSKYIKEIIQRLERIEKKVDECCGPICIDFTKRGTVKLSNPHTETLGNHNFLFSAPNIGGLDLEIKPDGLHIPDVLKIEISPPCKRITVEVSSYANLNWEAYDSSGNALKSIPPPPAPTNTSSFTFEITGDMNRLKFEGSNESSIKKICCSRR